MTVYRTKGIRSLSTWLKDSTLRGRPCGNEHGTVKGIGLVNFVHSAGNAGHFWPIDYRIYYPDTDGKTKNDHFEEMFMRLTTHKHLKARRILFDSWYASVTNLKLIHRHGWTFFTTPRDGR